MSDAKTVGSSSQSVTQIALSLLYSAWMNGWVLWLFQRGFGSVEKVSTASGASWVMDGSGSYSVGFAVKILVFIWVVFVVKLFKVQLFWLKALLLNSVWCNNETNFKTVINGQLILSYSKII